MSRKTATVIGATGLIGNHLVELLQEDNAFETVRAIVRRPVSFTSSKTEMKLVNFDDPESFKLAVDGSDAVFCAIGTTQQKVAGDKEAYRKIDYDIPVNAARFCAETGCPSFALVSSVGANAGSKNFYLKLKGEVEDKIKEYAIPSIAIMRPSLLLGKHPEFRLGERIAQPLSSFFAFLLTGSWEKYRPVDAVKVAQAMIQSSAEKGVTIYEYAELRNLAIDYSKQHPTAHPHLVR